MPNIISTCTCKLFRGGVSKNTFVMQPIPYSQQAIGTAYNDVKLNFINYNIQFLQYEYVFDSCS